MICLFGEHSWVKRDGITFIDLVVSIGIIGILFGGIFLAYSSILDSIANSQSRNAASSLLNRELEIIRNIPYEQVGTVGGVPSGILPQEKTVSASGISYTIKTTVRNIDDPFDGTVGGTPNDTAPADYKLVELEISCPGCGHFIPIAITTTVAPQALESASTDGSLFINVIDANGIGVPAANIHVTNSSVTPPIDLTDTTNASGALQLVGVRTSTQAYAITATKSGYSSERTYAPGDAANPNPLRPHATVAPQTVTQASFAIDRLGAMNVYSSNDVCVPVQNIDFSVSGAKLIGTSPDVFKFSTSSATNTSGTKTFSNMEWDTYSFVMSEATYDVVGTLPLSPAALNPASTLDFRFVVKPSAAPSLLVTVRDSATGGTVMHATTTITKGGFSATQRTGHSFLSQIDWSGNDFDSQSGGISAGTSLTLPGPPYTTSTTNWLVSKTFDVGSSTSNFYALNWSPTSQPLQVGAGSVQFQVAGNNDNATWNFVGPDGSAGTFYTAPGTMPSSLNNTRYLRYKVYLKTESEDQAPSVDDMNIEFNSVCVPKSQVLFNNLNTGAYTLTVDAAGYARATSSLDVNPGWNQTEILLSQ